MFINKFVHHANMVAGLKNTNWKVFTAAVIIILSTILVFSLVSFPVSAACTNWAGKPDNDCDGLADAWETTGYDYNNDGTVDLTFPGANPDHKDVYLEIDYMQIDTLKTHKPRPGVVPAVITAFANAPVSNPDTNAGINLHVTIDEPIPHQNSITMWSAFDALKNTWFGTPTEKNNGNPNTIPAKDNTYHYALFIHQYNGLTSSGLAEILGDDLIVSLGASGWQTNNGHNVGSLDQQKGTLMHELGHNFGLRHGGNVDENCKPNYLSVMSYSFQFSDFVSNRPLDYSRSQLNLLNESKLIEQNGVSPASTPSGLKTVYGPNSPRVSPPLSLPLNPIDWDRDGNPTETVSRNINNLGTGSGCTSTLNTLIAGFKDWSNLQFWGTTGGWGNGTSPDPESLGNLTMRENLTMQENLTIPGNITIPTNITITANLTSTGIDSDIRPGLDEKNVENLYSARQLNREAIEEVIYSLVDEDFKDPGSQSKNALIGQMRALANILSTPNAPPQAISALTQVISRMDSSFGGNPADDLIISVKGQQQVVPMIQNFIDALEQQ